MGPGPTQDDDYVPGKMFVGGLSRDTNDDMLASYFSQFGQVADVVAMVNPETGKCKGFGFITFANPHCVQTVLMSGPHYIDGKSVDPKPSLPRGQRPRAPQLWQPKKAFLGGIPYEMTEDQLKAFFEKYGKVLECYIMYDEKRKTPRGFGFVAFENEKITEELVDQKYIDLKGTKVEVKLARPRENPCCSLNNEQTVVHNGTYIPPGAKRKPGEEGSTEGQYEFRSNQGNNSNNAPYKKAKGGLAGNGPPPGHFMGGHQMMGPGPLLGPVQPQPPHQMMQQARPPLVSMPGPAMGFGGPPYGYPGPDPMNQMLNNYTQAPPNPGMAVGPPPQQGQGGFDLNSMMNQMHGMIQQQQHSGVSASNMQNMMLINMMQNMMQIMLSMMGGGIPPPTVSQPSAPPPVQAPAPAQVKAESPPTAQNVQEMMKQLQSMYMNVTGQQFPT